ncbi:MAG: class I adenylate-forming enzyme family protein [Burkholderiales bacterium]
MPVSLPDAIRVHAQATPERIAITAGTRNCSYGQLWRDALSFADWLNRSGFRAGDRVAMVLANCPEAVVACYGTWMAGGIAVPLNAQSRPRELMPWLRHCDPAVLVHESANADVQALLRMTAAPSRRVAVGDTVDRMSGPGWNEVIAEQGAPAPSAPPPQADDSAALILFTSGTTGQPKGVTLSHRNLASNSASIIQYLELTASDSVVSVLPFYYSYGNSVLNTHLAAGGRVVLEPNLVFPHVVVETIARERVSGFSGVPSTFALLLARVDLQRHDLGSLRYLTQAGGPMAVATTQRLLAAVPHARLFVMYGQTEATARLAWLPPEMLGRKLGSAGKAIPGVQLEIRSESRQPLAAGELGEVWAHGENVMLGYWRDAAQTAEVLSDGWLKTGDIGRMDADGYLFLEGRRTDMIKVGAHRIYPKDVEEAIAELPGVAEVAVVGVEDELLGQVIKAFVVPSVTGTIDQQAIQAHCRDRLAPYKIPKQVEFVAALPKTSSGKIRRRALVESAAGWEES